jgi:hypothetical protein
MVLIRPAAASPRRPEPTWAGDGRALQASPRANEPPRQGSDPAAGRRRVITDAAGSPAEAPVADGLSQPTAPDEAQVELHNGDHCFARPTSSAR